MKKSLAKGRTDFRRRVTLWGIEGGSINPCPDHPSVLLRSELGPKGGYEVIQSAWARGLISADAQGAIDLLDKILKELPPSCPECN